MSKWPFFSCLIFVEIIFYFSTSETRRFNEDQHGLCLDCTIQRRMLETKTGELLLEIIYLMSVDYLLLSWMWNYNYILDTITHWIRELCRTHELLLSLTQLRFGLHSGSSACKGGRQQTWTSMTSKLVSTLGMNTVLLWARVWITIKRHVFCYS